jgi:hypothetical protein
MFKKASKSVCTSTIVSRDLLSPTPSSSSARKTPGSAEADLDVPEPVDEGNIQMEYSSH